MKKLVLISALALIFSSVFAQINTPYKNVIVECVKSEIIQEFNRFEFLESVASGKDGSIYTTNLMQGLVYRIKDGNVKTLVDFDGMLAGLTFLDDNNFLLTGTSTEKEAVILQLNIKTAELKILARVPEAMLLNGITKLNKTNFLIADSFKGVIWKLDTKTASVSIWLQHELLSSPSIEKQSPGVNGIKVQGNSVYVSNTGKMLMVKIPLLKEDKAGVPEILHKNVFIDDFEMDAQNNIYGATHVYDNIIKISPKGTVTIIAEAEQGMIGCTCLTWKHGSENILLVSGNGGMLKENKAEVVRAKIVELYLNEDKRP